MIFKKSKFTFFRIHKEGYSTILFSFLFCSLSLLLVKRSCFLGNLTKLLIYFLLLIIFSFIVFFFRNPRIKNLIDDSVVLSPATGTVVNIGQVLESEYFKNQKILVSVFMSPLDVHVNRNPISGKVNYFKYHQGDYLVAWHDKSSVKNERTTVVVENASGVEILYRQIAGFLARRICYYIKKGDTVKQGDEFGFIKFGSRADIYLPTCSKVDVKVGDKLKAGMSVICKL